MDLKQEPLGHDEMWDDSVLIESWNEALAEYKKYHSIHATGGRVNIEKTPKHAAARKEVMSQGKVESALCQDLPSKSEGQTHSHVSRFDTGIPSVPSHANDANSAAPVAPQGLLSSVQDEGMKRLLMSWYYAGYYTGLHEGQQKRQEKDNSWSEA